MKTTKEMISVMQAYADGKKIEHNLNGLISDAWEDCTPKWDWVTYDYRIKPEPKYRPYKNADECFVEAQKHGYWMKHPTTEERILITCVTPNYVLSGENIFEFAKMVESYVWADDGTPCGVLEEK